MGKIMRKLRFDEYNELPWVSECEKAIRKKVEELSGEKLHLVPIGHGTESPEVIKTPLEEKIEYLDYQVVFKGKPIAIMEMSCTRYSFEGSKFFPINAYKVERCDALPTFFVYSLQKKSCELAERCWWITLGEAKDNLLQQTPIWLNTMRPGGIKPQKNYITNKYAWHRGLQSLMNELLKATPP